MYVRAQDAAPACGTTRFLTRNDLVRSAGLPLLGASYTFNDQAPADERVLEGQFDTLQLRPGLILHAANVRDLRTMNTSNSLKPGLKVVLLVDGATDLSFGHQRFCLGPASTDPADRHGGALVNLAEEDLFSRRWQRGRNERKVSLTLTPEWMEDAGLRELVAPGALRRFCSEHLARQSWTVSARARELARQILEPSSFLPGLQRLRLEARCIELAAEALTALAEPPPSPLSLRDIDRQRLLRLDDMLRCAGSGELSMTEIARAVGSNPVSLQALARRAWGSTVFERVRQIRMERARDMLLGGASVAQAAEAAGFSAATNFATAYRRRYGANPRKARAAQAVPA